MPGVVPGSISTGAAPTTRTVTPPRPVSTQKGSPLPHRHRVYVYVPGARPAKDFAVAPRRTVCHLVRLPPPGDSYTSRSPQGRGASSGSLQPTT